MAETAQQSSVITLGLSEIQVGAAAPGGTMPTEMTKIGKTYKDTCSISQDASDVTEHYEEGKSAPEVRKKNRKMPVVKFSLMNADLDMLKNYIGGDVQTNTWQYDGDKAVDNKAIRVITEQGLQFDIPNGDIEAVINGELSASGIVLVEVTVTPMAVTAGGAIQATVKK